MSTNIYNKGRMGKVGHTRTTLAQNFFEEFFFLTLEKFDERSRNLTFENFLFFLPDTV